MGRHQTWIDWGVLAACMMAALAVAFLGINALESTYWMQSARGHAAIGVLAVIAVVAVVNCAFLLGAAVCKLRRDRRLGRA
jgi:predicted Kef-type K+ transport protein